MYNSLSNMTDDRLPQDVHVCAPCKSAESTTGVLVVIVSLLSSGGTDTGPRSTDVRTLDESTPSENHLNPSSTGNHFHVVLPRSKTGPSRNIPPRHVVSRPSEVGSRRHETPRTSPNVRGKSLCFNPHVERSLSTLPLRPEDDTSPGQTSYRCPMSTRVIRVLGTRYFNDVCPTLVLVTKTFVSRFEDGGRPG